MTRDARGRKAFQHLALEEKTHLEKLEARYAELLQRDPQLEARPTFLFFKGAANGLFSEGAEALSRVTTDREALMLGIRCERGSHRFFKKYGERFEDSEGKRIFLEFADEEREHLELRIERQQLAIAALQPAKVIDFFLGELQQHGAGARVAGDPRGAGVEVAAAALGGDGDAQGVAREQQLGLPLGRRRRAAGPAGLARPVDLDDALARAEAPRRGHFLDQGLDVRAEELR